MYTNMYNFTCVYILNKRNVLCTRLTFKEIQQQNRGELLATGKIGYTSHAILNNVRRRANLINVI